MLTRLGQLDLGTTAAFGHLLDSSVEFVVAKPILSL